MKTRILVLSLRWLPSVAVCQTLPQGYMAGMETLFRELPILLLVLRTIKRSMRPLAAVLLALPGALHAAEATAPRWAGTAAERISRYNVV